MKQLVAYITTGFPDVAFSLDVIAALKEAGVDKLELGIPFSDPVADGPIIERANLASLHHGFTMQTLFEVSAVAAPMLETYWMGYFNPFYRRGLPFFAQKAQELGVKGFIIPDLPHEEASGYRPLFDTHGVHQVAFVAPTDSKKRIATLVRDAKGFIYLVAYAGITGAAQSEDLSQVISIIKAQTSTPLFVGFGVNEKTAKERAKGVDGVIVGSALVEVMLDERLDYQTKIKTIARKAKEIKEMINA